MNGHPVLHDVSPGRLALTTKMSAGVDVTGRPSLLIVSKVGQPTAVQALVHECIELELYSQTFAKLQPVKLIQQ